MRVLCIKDFKCLNIFKGEILDVVENGLNNKRLQITKNNKWICDLNSINGKEYFIILKEDTMKKSDLVSGLHAVELRNGNFYIVVGNQLLSDNNWVSLKRYDENLETFTNTLENHDIIKIYKHNKNFEKGLHDGFVGLIKIDYDLIWERKTERQKQIKELKKIIEDAANKIREIEGE